MVLLVFYGSSAFSLPLGRPAAGGSARRDIVRGAPLFAIAWDSCWRLGVGFGDHGSFFVKWFTCVAFTNALVRAFIAWKHTALFGVFRDFPVFSDGP